MGCLFLVSVSRRPLRCQLAAGALRAVDGFVRHFLACDVCRARWAAAHPPAEIDALAGPDAEAPVIMLWLWAAHNAVNEQLWVEAAQARAIGSPPSLWHAAYPPAEACPDCDLELLPGGSASRGQTCPKTHTIIAVLVSSMIVQMSIRASWQTHPRLGGAPDPMELVRRTRWGSSGPGLVAKTLQGSRSDRAGTPFRHALK
jgi:hypothetical protein